MTVNQAKNVNANDSAYAQALAA